MKSGVAEYWVVNLESKSMLQYSFSSARDMENLKTYAGEESIKSTAFAGLEISLGDIFAQI